MKIVIPQTDLNDAPACAIKVIKTFQDKMDWIPTHLLPVEHFNDLIAMQIEGLLYITSDGSEVCLTVVGESVWETLK